MNNDETREHAIYSPSRLAHIAACPWWTGGVSGDYAQRGSDIGADIAAAAIAGTPLEQEASGWGLVAVQQIMDERPQMVWSAEDLTDTQIPDVWGYPDIVGRDGFGSSVLIELKTGYGRRPTPIENQQIRAYVLGLFRQDRALECVDAYLVEVDQHLVTAETFTRDDVPGLHGDIVRLIDFASRAGRQDLRPGPHCAYCALRERCEALEESASRSLAIPPDVLPDRGDYGMGQTPSTA